MHVANTKQLQIDGFGEFFFDEPVLLTERALKSNSQDVAIALSARHYTTDISHERSSLIS